MNYPEMVRPNYRNRGPMESKKDSNAVRDIANSIELLNKMFKNNEAKTSTLKSSIYSFYNEQVPNDRKGLTTSVAAVRGGEL